MWKNCFSQLLNVHRVSDVRQIEIHTAEPLTTNPSPVEVQIRVYHDVVDGADGLQTRRIAVNIVAYSLKARIMESQQPAVTRQRPVNNNRGIVFSAQSVPLPAHETMEYIKQDLRCNKRTVFSIRSVPLHLTPRGGGFEYLHCSPASRRKQRKKNLVPGGITGHPVPGASNYGDLDLQVG
jgi:hypothetical protein